MKRLLFLVLSVMTVSGCREDILPEAHRENIPATRSAVGSSDRYYWCDGVKIPLTVDENKMYVLVETEKLERIRQTVITACGESESAGTNKSSAALGIRSSAEAGMQRSLASLTLDRAEQKSIDPKDIKI